MKKIISILPVLVFLFGVALMPSVSSAEPVELVDGFVCPVFNADSAAGVQNPNSEPIDGGDFTILGPDVSVPSHATNQDGAGLPGGAHASPGDAGYSAVWGVRP